MGSKSGEIFLVVNLEIDRSDRRELTLYKGSQWNLDYTNFG